MADQQQTIAAPFPTPPPFYEHFTKQNISRLRQLRKEAGIPQPSNSSNGEAKTDIDILALPTELRYLIPPPAPTDGKYRTFGTSIDLNAPDATLSEAGIPQLYPTTTSAQQNPQPHLIALTRSLLTTFLSLVGILSQNPAAYYEERVDSLQTIMYNIHDLINQYRPHQARESLVLMMEERVARMRDETRRIAEAKEKVEGILKGMRDAGEVQRGVVESGDGGVGGGGQGAGGGDDEKRRLRQRAAWMAIEQEMADASR